MIKTSGIIRNRLNDLLVTKGKKKIKSKRFSQAALKKTYQQDDFTKSPLVSNDSRLSQVQMQSTNLPSWSEDYKLCNRVLDQIDDLIDDIVKQQAKKMRSLKQEHHQAFIQKRVEETTKKIKFCQKTIKNIQKFNQPSMNDNQQDKKVFTSMIMSLALQIRQKTKKLRNTQQSQLNRTKQIQKYTENTELQLSKRESQEQTWFSQQNFEALQEKMIADRNQQILKIVQSIQSLNSIYKQLQELVIQQGSLLDNIQENINVTHKNIIDANKHLQKAQQSQNNSCAKRLRNILLAIIIICLLVLLIKHT